MPLEDAVETQRRFGNRNSIKQATAAMMALKSIVILGRFNRQYSGRAERGTHDSNFAPLPKKFGQPKISLEKTSEAFFLRP